MSGSSTLIVTPEQAGQKLVQFLGRVVSGDVPGSVFMRWIRTGQVRLDGKRAKPFDRVKVGQAVRLPPFAELAPGMKAITPSEEPDRAADQGHLSSGGKQQSIKSPPSTSCSQVQGDSPPPDTVLLAAQGLDSVAETPKWIVIAKPVGLPVHPGSGWADSVQTRLEKAFAGRPYVPVLAHRLDRDTSGVLLAARTHAALIFAHDAIRHGEAVKEYLCWVRGKWTLSGTGEPVELEDSLAKEGQPGREKMAVKGSKGYKDAEAGKLAHLTATPLVIRSDRALLAVRLHTGRTHQIRVQLSSRGYPLVGDSKYGGGAPPMRLHAFRLRIGGETFVSLPHWEGDWAVELSSDLP